MVIKRILCPVLLLAMLAGCAPLAKTTVSPSFRPAPQDGVVYVVPFVTALVPPSFSKRVFDDLVDYLNAYRQGTGIQWFFIIEQDLKDVEPSWLARQTYISGEIWSYLEESGCCKTELHAHARAHIIEAGKSEPSVVVSVPVEGFFDHDDSSLEKEREILARRLAHELGSRIISSFSGKPD